MALPPEQTENLKCKLCKSYLSVPPITVISENGDDYKCGRCDGIKTDVNIRMKMLESVLKPAKFPCIYKECKEQLAWGAVEAHEQMCPHKTFKCNLWQDCNDEIAIDDLEAHYTNPDGCTVCDRFERSLSDDDYGVHLIMKNEVPYFVYYDRGWSNFWIVVFSLKSMPNETAEYEVKLSSTTSNISVLYERQTVLPYNEREHCPSCLILECGSPYHKFARTNKGKATKTGHVQVTAVNLKQVIGTLGSDEFICSVNIIDGPRTPETNSPEPTNVSSRNNNELLRQILQCPICMEFMSPEIYMCSIGHVICKTCKPRLKACPTCGKDIASSRSYSLEEIAENVELACQHKEKGCNFVGNVANICKHQALCPYKGPDPRP